MVSGDEQRCFTLHCGTDMCSYTDHYTKMVIPSASNTPVAACPSIIGRV